MKKLFVKRLDQNAMLPKKGTIRAAGYDLFSNEDKVVPSHGKELIKTGISVGIPSGNYGRIAPRSGLALKKFIDVGAGVIDEDYTGEVCVLLFNFGEEAFQVNRGDRIAQMIIERITQTEIEEVQELESSERGAGGFGSTGISLDGLAVLKLKSLEQKKVISEKESQVLNQRLKEKDAKLMEVLLSEQENVGELANLVKQFM